MKHRIQMRAAASALAACICLSVLPGALAVEPGTGQGPRQDGDGARASEHRVCQYSPCFCGL